MAKHARQRLKNLINYALVRIYASVKILKIHINMYVLESVYSDSWGKVCTPVNQNSLLHASIISQSQLS